MNYQTEKDGEAALERMKDLASDLVDYCTALKEERDEFKDERDSLQKEVYEYEEADNAS